jgi:hypothetical protein
VFRKRTTTPAAPELHLDQPLYDDLMTWIGTQEAALGIENVAPSDVLAAALVAMLDSPLLSNEVRFALLKADTERRSATPAAEVDTPLYAVA